MISGMNRTKSRRGQPNTVLTVHGLLTVHGPNFNCKNVLNMGYIYHKKMNLFQNKLR